MTTDKRTGRFRSLARLLPSRRVLAVFSFTCTVLYVACWIGEVVQATREKMEGSPTHVEEPQKPWTDRARQNVQQLIEEIKRVDARDLGLIFLYDLKMWNCNWRFQCVPSDVSAGYLLHELRPNDWREGLSQRLANESTSSDISRRVFQDRDKPSPSAPAPGDARSTPPPDSMTQPTSPSDSVSIAIQENLEAAKQVSSGRKPAASTLSDADLQHSANDEPPTLDEFEFALRSPEPKLFAKGPIPTFHTLLGIPRAAFVTTRAIFKAGFWAVTIFIACGVLYFGVGAPVITILLRDRGKKDWDPLPLVVAGLVLISPIAIPILVGYVQSAAAALGTAVSWMVGLLAIVVTWSAAIGVLAGIPHVWKSPREVKEALHVIRHGVEAIEKH